MCVTPFGGIDEIRSWLGSWSMTMRALLRTEGIARERGALARSRGEGRTLGSSHVEEA